MRSPAPCAARGVVCPCRRGAANGQLAAVVDGRLVTLNADGSGLRTLWSPRRGSEITELAWSPDGNRLAFSTAGEIVVLELVDAGAVLTLTDRARDANPGLVGGRPTDRLPARRC